MTPADFRRLARAMPETAEVGHMATRSSASAGGRTPEDLSLGTIGDLVAGTSVESFIAWYEASRRQR